MNDVSGAFASFLYFWPDTPAVTLLFLAVISPLGCGDHSRFLFPSIPWLRNLLSFAARELSWIVVAYDKLYDRICGTHPNRRFWHCQWLSVKDIYRDLREMVPKLEGRLLDVGCMNKPYARWTKKVREHIGVDVFPGKSVDYLIRDGERWPFESASFESVLCTQALQVVRNVTHLVDEIDRVLVDDGIAVITAPFCYNDMSIRLESGMYKDYWRLTVHGLQELFAQRFEVVEIRQQGGLGSTTGVMLLNWIRMSLSRHLVTQVPFAVSLPFWLALCLAVNAVGWLLDKLDRTGAFYHNVCLVLRKKPA